MTEFYHVSVFERELVDALALKEGATAVDCTAGGGGHTTLLLQAVGNKGRVLAFDRDPRAMQHLEARFANEKRAGRLDLIRAAFSSLVDEVTRRGLNGEIDGICADLGVSSPQLDEAERGFSFQESGPLDMRMDTAGQTLTARDIVEGWDERELTRIFREWGEEPKAHILAREIVKARENQKFETTRDLADFIKKTMFYKEQSRKHPATRAFQALRIAVNDELGELERLLESALSVLKPGGRMAIIAFHSLEDRLVKRTFEDWTGKTAKIPRHLPLTPEAEAKLRGAKATIIKPFPLLPSEEEMTRNPRSRSARLRVIEKI